MDDIHLEIQVATLGLQSWKKVVGTPNAIYYNYPHVHHWNRKWSMTLFNIESRGVLAFTIIVPSPPPHQINVGGPGKASDNMTWINIAPGERVFFLLIKQSVPTIFSRIVAEILAYQKLKIRSFLKIQGGYPKNHWTYTQCGNTGGHLPP